LEAKRKLAGSNKTSIAHQRASVRALDGLQAEDAGRANAPSPGITLRIIHETPRPIVDITPTPQIIDAGERD
jgi:hypothetical protein